MYSLVLLPCNFASAPVDCLWYPIIPLLLEDSSLKRSDASASRAQIQHGGARVAQIQHSAQIQHGTARVVQPATPPGLSVNR